AGRGVLVSLSGDVAIAGDAPPEGWRVRVTDDHRAGAQAPGQTVILRDGGLATSSTQVRRWPTDSGDVHHLLDPATGDPARGPWRTVSVAARSCLGANIASTATVVRGWEAVRWLEELALPARLVSRATTVVHLGGWPAAGEDLLGGPAAVAA
ncbi:MAG: FAD:protein FMN transferase, partial [Actinomycetota bacterium]|nr:FAD:protein FMN transferase [Actinomycetota bacterium]